MNAAQTSTPPRVLNLSPPMTSMTSATDINLTVWVCFFLIDHVGSLGNHGAVCLTPIHPLTVVLAARVVHRTHALSQKQIKLTALRMGKVCEELSDTPMLTLPHSLYLNDSPGS